MEEEQIRMNESDFLRRFYSWRGRRSHGDRSAVLLHGGARSTAVPLPPPPLISKASFCNTRNYFRRDCSCSPVTQVIHIIQSRFPGFVFFSFFFLPSPASARAARRPPAAGPRRLPAASSLYYARRRAISIFKYQSAQSGATKLIFLYSNTTTTTASFRARLNALLLFDRTRWEPSSRELTPATHATTTTTFHSRKARGLQRE